jgi:uncharacterized protein (TIGR03067 family)
MSELLAARGMADMSVTFADQEMAMRGIGGADHAYRIEIDPTQRPKALDAITIETDGKAPAGERVKGIYRLDGDRLTLCLAADSTVARPTAFEAPEGSRTSLLNFHSGGAASEHVLLPPRRRPTNAETNIQEVAIAFESGKALLDLDTGRTLGPMATGSPNDVPEFEIYASFAVDGDRAVPVLMGQAANFVPVDEETWKSGGLDEVRDLLQAEDVQRESVFLAKPADESPARWAVETRLGAVVLVQAEYRAKIATQLSGDVQGFVVRRRVFSPTLGRTQSDAAVPSRSRNP